MNKNFEQVKQAVLNSFSEEELFKTSILNSPGLWETDLYKFCVKMPKGADLHSHGGAMIPAKELIKFVASNKNLVVDINPEHKGYICLAEKDYADTYMPLQEALDKNLFSKQELIECWTLIGCPAGTDVWDWFQELFEKHNDLNEVGPTCKDYFKYSYEYYCRHNIFHIEQRLFLKNSEEEAFAKAHCAFDAYMEAKEKYPELTVKIIPVGLKHPAFGMDVTENIFHNTAVINKKIKDADEDFIVGIDLVNEEDSSRSIRDFEGLIKQTLKEAPTLNVNLHAGETRKKDNDEIKAAIDMGSKRIGHGLNLWAHPELKNIIKEKNICLEVCPVSNQSLGFCDDLREHPAKDYLHEGIPMCLSSDDPTYQENETLIDDFFYAILAWDLSLDDVEQLIKNSINYSYINDKSSKLDKWEKDWATFLTSF